MLRSFLTATCVLMSCGVLLCSHASRAETFTTSFTNAGSGNVDSAQAVFSLITGTSTYLIIAITNTSTFTSAYKNADLISGFFFSLATDVTLTPVSAISPNALINAAACNTTACASPNVNVGGEWKAQYSSVGFSGTGISIPQHYGMASSQYSGITGPAGAFGNGNTNTFPTGATGLYANGRPQLAFSIAGANYNAATSSVSNKDPLIPTSSSVAAQFRYALPAGVTSVKITSATFTYGTAPDAVSGGIQAPEPASLAILAPAFMAMVGLRRSRRKG